MKNVINSPASPFQNKSVYVRKLRTFFLETVVYHETAPLRRGSTLSLKKNILQIKTVPNKTYIIPSNSC